MGKCPTFHLLGGQLSSGQLSGGQLSGGQLSGGQLSGGQLSYTPVFKLIGFHLGSACLLQLNNTIDLHPVSLFPYP